MQGQGRCILFPTALTLISPHHESLPVDYQSLRLVPPAICKMGLEYRPVFELLLLFRSFHQLGAESGTYPILLGSGDHAALTRVTKYGFIWELYEGIRRSELWNIQRLTSCHQEDMSIELETLCKRGKLL
ncbi:hypothetical protein BDZ91DRAFT_743370, partial [Kalaharituber pfeilii]